MTLQRATGLLVQLGEAEPAVVLAGAVSTHFPLSVAATHQYERLGIDETQVPARRALGEAAYSSAFRRGAAMDDDEMADYALDQFRRLGAPLAEPDTKTPESPPGQPRTPHGNES